MTDSLTDCLPVNRAIQHKIRPTTMTTWTNEKKPRAHYWSLFDFLITAFASFSLQPFPVSSIMSTTLRKCTGRGDADYNHVSRNESSSSTWLDLSAEELKISSALLVVEKCATFLDDSSARPKLRRAGSSMDYSVSSSVEEDVDGSSVTFETKEEKTFWFQDISNTFALQLKGLTRDFQKSGLPWDGPECRSVMAGCSGILFAAPALFCTDNPTERFIWILQGCLSVLADYFHIHHDSFWHGLDRYFATFNLMFIFYRAWNRLNSCVLLFTIPSVGFFFLANEAKTELNLAAWHWRHFGWHVAGGVLATLVIHLLYSCPDTNPFLAGLCQQSL